jgi:hypothetical protein
VSTDRAEGEEIKQTTNNENANKSKWVKVKLHKHIKQSETPAIVTQDFYGK